MLNWSLVGLLHGCMIPKTGLISENMQKLWSPVPPGKETPLHMAARTGNVQVAHLLVTHGAEVNARNLDDLTPLILAAQEGKQETGKIRKMGGNWKKGGCHLNETDQEVVHQFGNARFI